MKPELIRQRAYSYLRSAEATMDRNPVIAARLRHRGGEYLMMADLAEENSRRSGTVGFTASRQTKKKERPTTRGIDPPAPREPSNLVSHEHLPALSWRLR
jgi:hypothetical protein